MSKRTRAVVAVIRTYCKLADLLATRSKLVMPIRQSVTRALNIWSGWPSGLGRLISFWRPSDGGLNPAGGIYIFSFLIFSLPSRSLQLGESWSSEIMNEINPKQYVQREKVCIKCGGVFIFFHDNNKQFYITSTVQTSILLPMRQLLANLWYDTETKTSFDVPTRVLGIVQHVLVKSTVRHEVWPLKMTFKRWSYVNARHWNQSRSQVPFFITVSKQKWKCTDISYYSYV